MCEYAVNVDPLVSVINDGDDPARSTSDIEDGKPPWHIVAPTVRLLEFAYLCSVICPSVCTQPFNLAAASGCLAANSAIFTV
jgi:hypothetical protein